MLQHHMPTGAASGPASYTGTRGGLRRGLTIYPFPWSFFSLLAFIYKGEQQTKLAVLRCGPQNTKQQ